jgi:hypothetical protein
MWCFDNCPARGIDHSSLRICFKPCGQEKGHQNYKDKVFFFHVNLFLSGENDIKGKHAGGLHSPGRHVFYSPFSGFKYLNKLLSL